MAEETPPPPRKKAPGNVASLRHLLFRRQNRASPSELQGDNDEESQVQTGPLQRSSQPQPRSAVRPPQDLDRPTSAPPPVATLIRGSLNLFTRKSAAPPAGTPPSGSPTESTSGLGPFDSGTSHRSGRIKATSAKPASGAGAELQDDTMALPEHAAKLVRRVHAMLHGAGVWAGRGRGGELIECRS